MGQISSTTVQSFAAGDVVVVPFPYSDRLAQKRRPALVVSGAGLHALGLIWAVMITSARNSSHVSDYPLADLVRAVAPGHYIYPPATAEDMYKPDRYGRTGFGEIEVKAR